jgi:hypothetical protein
LNWAVQIAFSWPAPRITVLSRLPRVQENPLRHSGQSPSSRTTSVAATRSLSSSVRSARTYLHARSAS